MVNSSFLKIMVVAEKLFLDYKLFYIEKKPFHERLSKKS
jgi:hypothetical protein